MPDLPQLLLLVVLAALVALVIAAPLLRNRSSVASAPDEREVLALRHRIAIDSLHHRQKIATRLLHDLIGQAVEMGAEAVSLEVRITNWGAQRLYGRFGFRPAGVRKNYYQELQEDALIMWVDEVRTPRYAERLARIAAGLPEGIRP